VQNRSSALKNPPLEDVVPPVRETHEVLEVLRRRVIADGALAPPSVLKSVESEGAEGLALVESFDGEGDAFVGSGGFFLIFLFFFLFWLRCCKRSCCGLFPDRIVWQRT
jgi:hypothetical protein